MGGSGAKIGVRSQGGTENEAVAAARPILLPSLSPYPHPSLCSLRYIPPWAT